MRRLVSFSILLLVLFITACSGSTGKCKNGLCIEAKSIGPIKKGESVPIQVKVKSDNDCEVGIIFGAGPAVTLEEASDTTGLILDGNKNKSSVNWKKKSKSQTGNYNYPEYSL